MLRKGLVLLAVALLAAGCATERTAPFPFDEVGYLLVGGVAGYNRSLTITGGGDFTLVVADGPDQKIVGKLSTKELNALRSALHGVPWKQLAPDYVDVSQADSPTETFRLDAPGNRRTITVTPTAAPPETLRILLDNLRNLMNSHT